ncbi:MAG: Mur ligase family protein [Alphaproteobacteria bacterium]
MLELLIAVIPIYLAWIAFATKRTLTFLHIYQQEEYDSRRFLNWIWKARAFDKRLSLALLASGAAMILINPFLAIGFPVSFAWFAYREKDPRKESKKKLVMTDRAKRIFVVAILIAAIIPLLHPVFYILGVQLIPLFIVLANAAFQPYEARIQKKFWNEAHAKLAQLNPVVIGITGSFGKTSVKHILGHILKTHAPTLVTPGSVNTPMGITRIIREQLEDNHKYFIAEMGAYGPGSIQRLCDLAPPDMGIITAIGHAHYERFKTIDTVAEAKFELAQNVLKKNGNIIVTDQTLEFPHSKAMAESHKGNFIICGDSGNADLKIGTIEQTPNGLTVSITWKNAPYQLNVPLYGLHHGRNAALAFAAAASLGLALEHIITALKSVPQVTHRLEVKKQGGTILIDDAYNSNPEGFKSAIELMPIFGGRKILVTPGMVELGAAHDDAHEKIGQLSGKICDIVLLVQGKRIPTFIKGFKETGSGRTLIEVGSFAEASAWLDANRQNGDVVLLENDLPDIYERKLKI